MVLNEFPGNLSVIHLYYLSSNLQSPSPEPGARYPLSAKARICHSFLSQLPASIAYTSVVQGFPLSHSWRSPLPLGYSCLLDTGLRLLRKYTRGRRGGQRFLLWTISTFHSQLLFSTQGSLTMGLKMGLNYGWSLWLTQCGRWIENTGMGGSMATLGKGMHLEFLTLQTLERGMSCFECLLLRVARASSLGLDVFYLLSPLVGLQVPACQLSPGDWKGRR